MDKVLKFGELFDNPRENLEILGTKQPVGEENYCQHCGKVVKKIIRFKDHNTGTFISYGINHAAEILGFSMKEFKRLITKANKAMLLKFMPEYKKHVLYPLLRHTHDKKKKQEIRDKILASIEQPNFFLPDVNAKGS